MNDVFFTICIPTYNSENIVEKAIISAVNQEFDNYEILIVDDNSTDNTLKVAEKYTNNLKVRIIKNEKNLGMNGNWNKCLRLSKGKFIAFVHHDDSVKNFYLKDAWTIISQNKNVGIISFENQTQKRSPFYGLIKGRDYFRFIFKWKYVIPPSQAIFINLPDLYYDANLNYSPEADLYLQIIQQGYDVFFSEKKGSIRNAGGWDQNVSSKMYYKWMVFKDRIQMIKKWISNPFLDDQIIFSGLRTTSIAIYERRARAVALKVDDAENLIDIYYATLNENKWFGIPKLKQLSIFVIGNIFFVKKYLTSKTSSVFKIKK